MHFTSNGFGDAGEILRKPMPPPLVLRVQSILEPQYNWAKNRNDEAAYHKRELTRKLATALMDRLEHTIVEDRLMGANRMAVEITLWDGSAYHNELHKAAAYAKQRGKEIGIAVAEGRQPYGMEQGLYYE